jgi:hypothetical protein
VVSNAQFLLRLPQEMRDAAAEAARAEGVTGSEWIRRAITERLDRQNDTSFLPVSKTQKAPISLPKPNDQRTCGGYRPLQWLTKGVAGATATGCPLRWNTPNPNVSARRGQPALLIYWRKNDRR